MPITAVPVFCLCGHAADDHTTAGRCRADDDGERCGCRDYEQDEEA